MILVVQLQEPVEYITPSVERKTQIPDTALLTLLQQKIKQPIIHIPLLETLKTGCPDSVKQIIVEIISPQLLHRIVIHLQSGLTRRIIEIRQLGRNIIRITRIAAERNSGSLLRLPLEIGR